MVAACARRLRVSSHTEIKMPLLATRRKADYATFEKSLRCAWTALLPERNPTAPLRGQVDCAVAVIGAGLVGLAAARRLAELAPGDPVVVLDAGRVGDGAAGRNSGFAIDVPLSHAMHAKDSLGAIGGTQLALSRWSYAWLERQVREGAIDCGWTRAGRHYAAATEGGRRALDAVARQFEQLGEAAERVDSDALRECLGTGYYRAALFNPSCTLVQPAALIRGLADTLPPPVRLHENSRVTGWRRERGRHLLQTELGMLRARRVVWATHTDLDEFTPLGRRYLTLHTYAGVTPPLPDAALGHGRLAQWGVLPALRAGSTVRRLADGRILVRSLWSYGRPLAADMLRRALQPLLAARFPLAAAQGFEHVWGGPVAITRGGDPYLGEFRPGAFAFAGCNGSGIVKGSAYGMLLAELAADRPSEALELARREHQAAWIPPEPLRRIAVAVTLAHNARHAAAEI